MHTPEDEGRTETDSRDSILVEFTDGGPETQRENTAVLLDASDDQDDPEGGAGVPAVIAPRRPRPGAGAVALPIPPAEPTQG